MAAPLPLESTALPRSASGSAAAATARPLAGAFYLALLHAPLILAFFAADLARSMDTFPVGLRTLLWLGAGAQALFLGALLFAVTLPFAWTRVYAWLAPLAMGLATVVLGGDAILHHATSFHFNRLFLQVALQPNAIQETGLAGSELAGLLGGAVAFVVLDVAAGRWLLRRWAGRRPLWRWLVVVIALAACARVGHAAGSFFGGESVHAAGAVLPLQVPLRMNAIFAALSGKKLADPADLFRAAGQPQGEVDPASIHLSRRPDVVFVLIESLRADAFDEATMPNLSRRGRDGLVFDRHYSSASSTHFSLFSLFFGLPATRSDAVIGSGRTSLLFPTLKNHDYQMRLLAASSVDWMSLKRSVFNDVQDELETDFHGEGYQRDDRMLESARHFVAGADPDRPLFLFLFFVGTHFRYSYPPGAEPFTPCWNGKGAVTAGGVEPALLDRRARNAAHEVDRKLEEFLAFEEAKRGKRPLLVVTGDHGEEFLEHGRFGHASDVTEEQIHVPFVLADEGLAPGVRHEPTGHIDVLPTLLDRLGSDVAPEAYCAGVPMTAAPPDRYLLTTVGWEPRLALVGRDLKVRFLGQDLGFGGLEVTDPLDRPLPDGDARFAAEYPNLLRSLRRQRP
jgi:membrane-anchored protein YejM (alkaline phosphatase superfamily)